jgi:hypothetical protein
MGRTRELPPESTAREGRRRRGKRRRRPSVGFHDGRRRQEQRRAEVRKKLATSPPEEILAVPPLVDHRRGGLLLRPRPRCHLSLPPSSGARASTLPADIIHRGGSLPLLSSAAGARSHWCPGTVAQRVWRSSNVEAGGGEVEASASGLLPPSFLHGLRARWRRRRPPPSLQICTRGGVVSPRWRGGDPGQLRSPHLELVVVLLPTGACRHFTSGVGELPCRVVTSGRTGRAWPVAVGAAARGRRGHLQPHLPPSSVATTKSRVISASSHLR